MKISTRPSRQFAQKEIEKERGADIFAGDEKALRKLRTACEKAKRELSVANHASIECFIGEIEINMKITREQFEKVLRTDVPTLP